MKKWTPSQTDAIHSRESQILVSASAGSGKTTVMIERIISLIANRETTVDQILMMTFTRASAEEARTRLRARLETMLEQNPDEYLSGQLDALGIASIGTFHKFCGELIRSYFTSAGVSPDFSIMDETEGAQLQNEILDQLITDNYDTAATAIDAFSVNRNTDKFKQLIISIYNFLTTRAEGEQWLDSTAFSAYQHDLAKNPAMQTIIEYYSAAGTHFEKVFQHFQITAQHENRTKIMPSIIESSALAQLLAKANTYQDLNKIANLPPFERLISDKDYSEYESFKCKRDAFKGIIKKIQDNFATPLNLMLKNQDHDKKLVTQIASITKQFAKIYNQQKLEKSRLDFADLERYAERVLTNPEIAAVVRSKYRFIFVDEYQDTNPVQESILRALSCKQQTTYVVGDIKQSIYGFRGCEAAIFSQRQDTYDAGSGSVVRLNENFRSNPAILNFANNVFSRIMSRTSAGVDYCQTGQFNPGLKYPEDKQQSVEVLLIDTQREEQEKFTITKPYDITTDNQVDPDLKSAAAQSALIAQRIAQFLKNKIWDAPTQKFRETTLGDIAILARSATHFPTLCDTLRTAGIDYTVTNKQNSAELPEIAILNNMLFAVSNFRNDVPLVLTMQSFIFGFTPDDLATIKLSTENGQHGRNECFYDRLVQFAGRHENQHELTARIKHFLAFLNKYYQIAKRNNVADTLDTFIAEYHIYDSLLLAVDGASKIENIQSLIMKLRTASYGATVSNYLYLLENELLELNLTTSSTSNDRVQIMTMHGSKGLEFPIVFIFDTGAQFSTQDRRSLLVIDKQCGLCVYSLDADEFTKTNSIARMGAVISGNRVQTAEEMRLLYVALTRAKNNLIIVGAKNISTLSTDCTDFDIMSARNYLSWLAPIILAPVRHGFSLDINKLRDIKITKNSAEIKLPGGKSDPAIVRKLTAAYNHQYPNTHATRTVLKNSVTALTKSEQDVIEVKPRQIFDCDRAAVGDTNYGTQFHSAMQCIDFDNPISDDKNVLTAAKIIAPMLANKRVLRELPFLQTIHRDGADILIQGVIDLLIIDEFAPTQRAVLIDYKTSRQPESLILDQSKPQLLMYRDAIAQATGITDIKVYIYSTTHSKLIKIQ
jgi:ATP-dependent helicase/nuclease subunit A